MNILSDRAFAIKIGQRYFRRYGKGGRVLTAWSLAGATLFVTPRQAEADVRELLQRRPDIRVVGVGEDR